MSLNNRTNILSRLHIACVGLLLLSLLTSCSKTKGLVNQQKIYTGTTLNIQDENQAESINNFKANIEAIPKQGTQFGLLNTYTGLHNMYESSGEKGFKHWVKYKLGKEPIIFESKQIKTTAARLEYYLTGKGFFNADVVCDTVVDDRLAAIACDINLGNRYQVDSIIFPVDSTYAELKLDQRLQRAVIKEGSYYDRDKLAYERTRIAQLANNLGFVDFGEEHVYYYVDTLVGDHKLNIYLEIVQPNDSTFHKQYRLNDITIYPNYSLNARDTTALKEKQISDRVRVRETDHYLNHELLNRLIMETPGEYYNKTNEKRTINRLLDLGLFKFVNVKNRLTKSTDSLGLSQDIYLTPEPMQSVSGEVELNNRSGNFFGTGASVSYLHKNIFGHAESFKLTLSGQVEAQFGDELSFINSSDVNIAAELNFPRFIVPFINIRESVNYIPRTVANTNYTYQRRIQFYTLQSATIKYGYRWRETRTKQHEFFPVVINQLLVRDKTDEFQDLLDADQRLAASFEDILIAGLSYSFTYNDQVNNSDRQYNYFKGELETSGNLISLSQIGSSASPSQIGNIPFAQFTKVTLDYRHYLPLRSGDLATRVLLGAGIAYGNSTELPYTKQYLIGGSNSIRAFPLRGLGPGKFVADPDEDSATAAQFIDQTGDMKLELNAEYRFPIFSYLKGALFVDAGNVWLINNPEQPDGNFRFNDFYESMAIGTGVGFRLDFGFFLLRLDTAFPLRGPVYQEDFEWKFDQIDFGSSSWRGNNLQFNFGIGYPF